MLTNATRAPRALILLFAGAVAACGGGTDTGPVAAGQRDVAGITANVDAAAADTAEPEDAAEPADEAEVAESKPDVPVTEPDPGPQVDTVDNPFGCVGEGDFGCPCETGADCFFPFCVPTSLGYNVCSTSCMEGCPLDDWTCSFVRIPGQDKTYACLETTVTLCRPCTRNEDCQLAAGSSGDRCVVYGESDGAFCARSCTESAHCPPDYACEEKEELETGETVRQCVLRDGECGCSPRAVADEASTLCFRGLCEGSRVCGADGLSACDAPVPTDEACDGVDNDCNGETDELYEDGDEDGQADCVDIDDDADGIVDAVDNCPLHANADQADANGDGIGNACDVEPPGMPILTGTVPDSPANENTPRVVGTAEVGATVELFLLQGCPDSPAAQGDADASGAFEIALPVDDDTTNRIFARTVDKGGNQSACTADPVDYVEDSTPPEIPSVAGTEPSSPSRDVPTPKVVGLADPSVLVRVHAAADCSDTPLATGISNASGIFGVPVHVGENSSIVLHVDAVDTASNVSGCSAGVEFVHDDLAPPAPEWTGSIPESPTNETNQPVVAGMAGPGDTIRIFTDNACLEASFETVSAAADGTFSLPVSAGSNAVTRFHAQAVDAARNISPCSGSLPFEHDDVPPDVPTLDGTDPEAPTNATLEPAVLGLAEAGSTVEIFSGEDCEGASVGSGEAAGDGAFRVTAPAAANGETSYRARAVDPAGNASGCSDPIVFLHDSVAPDAPTISATVPPSPSSVRSPNIVGVAEPLSTVDVFLSETCAGAPVGSIGAGADGAFEALVIVEVVENTESAFHARATDAAGNASACSAAFPYRHDKDPPAKPVIESTTPASPNNITARPTAEGTGERDATIRIYTNADCTEPAVATGAVTGDGRFSIEVILQDNDTATLSARAFDPAGNGSECSDALEYTHDDTSPDPPGIDGTDPTSPNKDTTSPEVSGTTEAGATVRIFTSEDCTGIFASTAIADDTGAWAANVSVVANATTSLAATSADALGNTSKCGSPIAFTHDNIAPGVPVATGTRPDSPDHDASPELLGGAEPLSRVLAFPAADCGGDHVGTTAAGSDGTFAVNVDAQRNTMTTWYLVSIDAADNVSSCSAGISYAHDDVPPDAPILASTDPSSPSAVSTVPAVLGVAEAGITVRIFAEAGCSGDAVASGVAAADGTFRIDVILPDNATHELTANAVDGADNASGCSNRLIYRHDDTPPGKPNLRATEPSSPSNASLTPDLLGRTEANATVEIFNGIGCAGAPIQTLSADGIGDFRVTLSAQRNLSVVWSARATDDVGNISACSDPRAYVHDDVAPALPTVHGTVPPSPSPIQTPRILGAAEPDSDVLVFTLAGCAGDALAQGSASGDGGFDITVNVPNNAESVLYVQSVDAAGNRSTCTSGTPYRHDDLAPPPPTFLESTPPTHNNETTAPNLNGIAENGGTVDIYLADDCSGDPVASGTSNPATGLFAIGVTVDPNSSTFFYARVTDGSGNASACTPDGFEFIHDTIAPEYANHDGDFDVVPLTITEMEVRWVAATDTFTPPESISHQICVSTEPQLCLDEFDNFIARTVVGSDPDNPQMKVTLSDLEQGKRHYFDIRAVDLAGNRNDPRIEKSAKTFGTRGAVSVATGDAHTCAALSDGTVSCWGDNGKGQLGTGNFTSRVQPVNVRNITNARVVSTGSTHSCALLANGRVQCWGLNSSGQIGDNSQTQRTSPRNVRTVTNVHSITSGAAHNCAVALSGVAWCWGANDKGQVGDQTTFNRFAPVQVVGIDDAVVQIASGPGAEHTCARTAVGDVWCWGLNNGLQCGHNLGNSEVPTKVASMPGPAAEVSVGGEHSCALLANGDVYCWGSNLNGQLGIDTPGGSVTRKTHVPSKVPVGGRVIKLAAGALHQCALMADSTMKCWGWNQFGQLGTDAFDAANPEDQILPVPVTGLDRAVVVGAGDKNTCASLSDGTLRCWGANSSGQVGDGTTERRPTPVPVTDLLAQVAGANIDAGANHTCGISARGEARCWGRNNKGQLGDGTQGDQERGVLVTSLDHAVSIAAGEEHSCALRSDGTVRCWGANVRGQLGVGGGDRSTPVSVAGVGGVKAISSGDRHTCALISDGTVACWGENLRGECGLGFPATSCTPSLVPTVSNTVDIAAGGGHACALSGDGTVACWGNNSDGQSAADPDVSGTLLSPAAVSDVTGARELTAGSRHTCALLGNATVVCWGANDRRQLGNTGVTGDNAVQPTAVSGVANATAIAAGGDHTCARRADGLLFCWGADDHGQSGGSGANGDLVVVPAKAVSGVTGLRQVSAGSGHTCYLADFGLASCFGLNDLYQLGNGSDLSPAHTPTRVRSFP